MVYSTKGIRSDAIVQFHPIYYTFGRIIIIILL